LFSFSVWKTEVLNQYVENQIGFLVSCGYFRATRRFFGSADFVPRDIAYVAHQLGYPIPPSDSYPDRTRQRHQQIILGFHGFEPFNQHAKNILAVDIATMARMHLKPCLIFDRCVDFLVQHHTQVPTARSLTDLIRAGLHDRKAELVALVDNQLSDSTRKLLDDLFTAPDDHNRYRLTLLKKLSQSARPAKIKEAVADFEILSGVYHQLGGVLAKLDLGVAGIRYFAGSVLRSEIFQIQRRDQNDRYIHATAFVAHQFYRCQDNMIDLWLSVMASFKSAATRESQEKLALDRKDHQRRIEIIVDGLYQFAQILTRVLRVSLWVCL
jgi:hypothetical protein